MYRKAGKVAEETPGVIIGAYPGHVPEVEVIVEIGILCALAPGLFREERSSKYEDVHRISAVWLL